VPQPRSNTQPCCMPSRPYPGRGRLDRGGRQGRVDVGEFVAAAGMPRGAVQAAPRGGYDPAGHEIAAALPTGPWWSTSPRRWACDVPLAGPWLALTPAPGAAVRGRRAGDPHRHALAASPIRPMTGGRSIPGAPDVPAIVAAAASLRAPRPAGRDGGPPPRADRSDPGHGGGHGARRRGAGRSGRAVAASGDVLVPVTSTARPLLTAAGQARGRRLVRVVVHVLDAGALHVLVAMARADVGQRAGVAAPRDDRRRGGRVPACAARTVADVRAEWARTGL